MSDNIRPDTMPIIDRVEMFGKKGTDQLEKFKVKGYPIDVVATPSGPDEIMSWFVPTPMGYVPVDAGDYIGTDTKGNFWIVNPVIDFDVEVIEENKQSELFKIDLKALAYQQRQATKITENRDKVEIEKAIKEEDVFGDLESFLISTIVGGGKSASIVISWPKNEIVEFSVIDTTPNNGHRSIERQVYFHQKNPKQYTDFIVDLVSSELESLNTDFEIQDKGKNECVITISWGV